MNFKKKIIILLQEEANDNKFIVTLLEKLKLHDWLKVREGSPWHLLCNICRLISLMCGNEKHYVTNKKEANFVWCLVK